MHTKCNYSLCILFPHKCDKYNAIFQNYGIWRVFVEMCFHMVPNVFPYGAKLEILQFFLACEIFPGTMPIFRINEYSAFSVYFQRRCHLCHMVRC